VIKGLSAAGAGMVGELVRREAEIAIAPLTINSQREQVGGGGWVRGSEQVG